MERAVEEAGDAEAVKLLRPIEYLNVLGNISPMIGLFGTVFGMIVAFQALVAGSGSADPKELAGGISTAPSRSAGRASPRRGSIPASSSASPARSARSSASGDSARNAS